MLVGLRRFLAGGTAGQPSRPQDSSASARFFGRLRPFQPLRQQRAGGDPAGADLGRGDVGVQHQAFGEIDGTVAVVAEGRTKQHSRQLVTGQVEGGEVRRAGEGKGV